MLEIISKILPFILVFFSGAIYELACVFWVHFSEKGKPYHTAVWSMIVAGCQIVGIGESIKDMKVAPFFIIGYGVGSFIGVHLNKNRKIIDK